MPETFRCSCGYINDLPNNALEAISTICPGCNRSLSYLYDEKENETRINREISTALGRAYIPIRLLPLAWLAIWVICFASQPDSLQSMGWGPNPSVLKYVQIVLWMLAFPVLGLISGPIVNLLYLYWTKKHYVQDRVAFVRVGAYDLAMWMPVASCLLVSGLYWSTWTKIIDLPNLPIMRSPGGFMFSWFLVTVTGYLLLSWVLFKLRRPNFGRRSL
jgi:hypothetical protein